MPFVWLRGSRHRPWYSEPALRVTSQQRRPAREQRCDLPPFLAIIKTGEVCVLHVAGGGGAENNQPTIEQF